MNLHFELSRILEGDGIGISLTGMLIVFAGLAFTSGFIANLPRCLLVWDRLVERRSPPAPKPEGPAAAEESEELPEAVVHAAIAVVLEHELRAADGTDLQRITLRRSTENSIWGRAGRMRTLNTNFHPPRRTP